MSEKKERIFVCDKDNITRYENNLVTLTLQNGEVFEKLEPRRLLPCLTKTAARWRLFEITNACIMNLLKLLKRA